MERGYEVLYSFQGGADGQAPFSGVVVDAQGNIFGTTTGGGSDGCGTVYEVSPQGSSYSNRVLYSFDEIQGCNPLGISETSDGALYVDTPAGGANGVGSVVKLEPAGSTYSVTARFSMTTTGGFEPEGGTFVENGIVYVITSYGGANGAGSILALDAGDLTGGDVYDFDGIVGGASFSTFVADSKGNLYATSTGGGGQHGAGTVFELAPQPSGGYLASIVFAFVDEYGNNHGVDPRGPVAFDQKGNIYGTTAFGGTFGDGIVFELTHNPGGYYETVLHNFSAGHGQSDFGALTGVTLSGGNLWGTAVSGYANKCDCGIIFDLSLSGSRYKVRHAFKEVRDASPGGKTPQSPLFSSGGSLYGTTYAGGEAGYGTVYRYVP
jgi:uncharacterized repeat protein (TIGR03803 family)